MAPLTSITMIALLHCGLSLSPIVAPSRQVGKATSLGMTPRYDPFIQRWGAMEPEEEASAGYSPFGSLLRQGPLPFIQRLIDGDKYDQGVLKMMANSYDEMDRNEAQGNMDAYLNNPNDWALQKVEEKNGAPKFNYASANMDPQLLILTATWSSILLTVVGRVVYVGVNGCDQFCRDYHF